MKHLIDEFVLDAVFTRVDGEEGTYWYRACADSEGLDGGEGYVVVWPVGDGTTDHLHTYKQPEEVWK